MGILETIERCINLGPGKLTIRQLQRALRVHFDVHMPLKNLDLYLYVLARTGRIDMVTGTRGTRVWPKGSMK